MPSNAVAARNGNGDHSSGTLIEAVVIKGDLSKLTPEERANYYGAVCRSVGLNPLTQPFAYITLNGKLTLYALRNCTDQLRTIHGVSVADMTEGERDGVYIVTCKVSNRDGRTDMAKGAVNIAALKGEALANAIMKAETKAKRRATLSICGLGFLDETEIEDIPAVAKRENPHVTRASDIAELPPPNSEDWFPPATDGIKPLPKKDARPIGEALQKEMHAITDVTKLRTWKKASEKRAQVLPDDWREILGGRYKEHRESLLAQPVAKASPPPQDLQPGETYDAETGEVVWGEPEAAPPRANADDIPEFLRRDAEPSAEKANPKEAEWLKTLSATLRKCTDVVSVGEVQKNTIVPLKSKLSASTWKAADALVREHVVRVQQTVIGAG
jgi:hypothetical protein